MGYVSINVIQVASPGKQPGGAENPPKDTGKPVEKAKSRTQVTLPLTVMVQKIDDFPYLVKSVNRIAVIASDNGAIPGSVFGLGMGGGMGMGGMGMGGMGGSVALSHSNENEARTRALAAAIQDAERNAKRLAQETGSKLREIIAVSDSPSGQLGGQSYGMMMGMGMGAGSSLFDPVTGQKEITMTASVTYSH